MFPKIEEHINMTAPASRNNSYKNIFILKALLKTSVAGHMCIQWNRVDYESSNTAFDSN